MKYKMVIARIQLNRLNKLELLFIHASTDWAGRYLVGLFVFFRFYFVAIACWLLPFIIRGWLAPGHFGAHKIQPYQSAHAHCAHSIHDAYSISFALCVSKLPGQ